MLAISVISVIRWEIQVEPKLSEEGEAPGRTPGTQRCWYTVRICVCGLGTTPFHPAIHNAAEVGIILPTLERGTETQGQLVTCPRPSCGKRLRQGSNRGCLPTSVFAEVQGHLAVRWGWDGHALLGLGRRMAKPVPNLCVSWERRVCP